MKKTIRKRNKLGQFTKASSWENVVLMRALKQMSLKLLALALIVGLNGMALSRIGYTMGYYIDVEDSTENTLIAGSVDFLLGVSGWIPPETAVSMAPGDITKKEVEVDPQDSNPFQYFVESNNFSGDTDFCEGLKVIATLEGEEMHNGPITGLLTDPTTILDSWEFTYTTGVNDFQNKICDFDVGYNGWQTRHDYPTYENGGFNDTEKVKNHLASLGFRINKVYYDVKSPERGVEGANEWVEIYNQTNTALDISGWEICDNISCDILPTTPLIPAQKYAIIVADPSTVSSGLPAFWYLPSEVTMINLGELIGNGLANEGDRLILKRPDGVVVDQMNWRDDTGVWNPGAVDVAEGNVLARVPSGYDTDMPSDWKELKPPSVDLIYPDEASSYTWYWTYSYPITWTATNNNGDDEDLDISIFYDKDVNQNGIIDVGDTFHTIAETTENDGLFDWTVPSGFIGYIWIHLVATGPENPMLNTGRVSGKIYDPFPIFVGPENIEAPELPIELPAEPASAEETLIEPEGSSEPEQPVAETSAAESGSSILTEETEIVAPELEVAPVAEETVIPEETLIEPEGSSEPEQPVAEEPVAPEVVEEMLGALDMLV